jgi:aminopeptidase N
VIRRSLALAVATGLLAAPLVASQPASGRVQDPHGASGIGDPYFPLDGNGGIDVKSYDVHDRYEFASGRLTGRTRISLVATANLSGFNLDFLLPVRWVRVGGEDVGFDQRRAHELSVRRHLEKGQRLDVVVRYAGRPGRYTYLGESNWLASSNEVVAMNEPHMAPWWFPANDHPLDKAQMTISITARKDAQVVSNGNRVGRTVDGRLATTTWRADEPMAPYLAFFAAGDFRVAQGSDHGHPWVVAVSKHLQGRDDAMSLLRKSAEYVAWIEEVLGAPYPFSTTGGVATSLNPYFALENQTRPTYDRGALNVTTVVHELAHQWFGDSVSVAGWKDIWLNEGSATFFEVYYEETQGGETGDDWLRRMYEFHEPGDSFWDHEVADPCPSPGGCTDVLAIFDDYVYTRGAMALQALRNVIGDDDFFEVLRTWVTENEGGNADTAEFQTLAEAVSGQDLGAFFDVWLHATEKPADTAANGLPQ